MFFKKKKSVLVECIETDKEMDRLKNGKILKTQMILPLLSNYGEYIIYDHKIISEVNSLQYELLYLTKVYSTERQRKLANWNFLGCSLKIIDDSVSENLFCYNGKVFDRIVPSDFIIAKKIKGFKSYSTNGMLTINQEEMIKRYTDWLESKVCHVLSYTYALRFNKGEIQVIFWKPDINVVEVIKDTIEFALEEKE